MNKIDLKTNPILYYKMPLIPIDYSKTIIYKIVCNDLNICVVYVGSTTDFIRRKNEHKPTIHKNCCR